MLSCRTSEASGVFNSGFSGYVQEEETHRSLVLFINAVLVSPLIPSPPTGRKRSILLLDDAELSVKYASMGSGLVTVHSFFSFGW